MPQPTQPLGDVLAQPPSLLPGRQGGRGSGRLHAQQQGQGQGEAGCFRSEGDGGARYEQPRAQRRASELVAD